jgi:hypothetical protein
MKPMQKVYQTTGTLQGTQTVGEDGKPAGVLGDCWPATVATVLGLEIKDVPRFADICRDEGDEAGFIAYHEFMRLHGYNIFEIHKSTVGENAFERLKENLKDSPYFMAGKSQNGDWLHVVVYKNGKLWHDPNGSGKGLRTEEFMELLVPVENMELN